MNGGTPGSQPDLHPREVIRKYKAELEVWDTYSWKQVMNSLESLRKAWERRMHELDMRTKQLSTNWGVAAQHELAQYKNVGLLIYVTWDVVLTPSPYVIGVERRGNKFLWVDPIILCFYLSRFLISLLASVAASSYQLKEVLDGYRQSTDTASKRRVREAMNAAVRGLPEYPPPNY